VFVIWFQNVHSTRIEIVHMERIHVSCVCRVEERESLLLCVCVKERKKERKKDSIIFLLKMKCKIFFFPRSPFVQKRLP
jgi:hypothetical protein